MALKYLNLTGLTNLVTDIMNWVTSRIPTKTSEIDNDSGFLTASDLPTNHVTTNTTQTISGAKTFSTDIGISANANKYLIIKNSTWDEGQATPSSNKELGGILLRDKDNMNIAYIIPYDWSNGWSAIQFKFRNRFTNNARDVNGTRVESYLEVGISPTGISYIKWNSYVNNNILPYSDNTHTLGNSSHKWKQVYANTYYLGTTAFGDIVTHNASEFATSGHTHSYLPLTGGTLTGDLTVKGSVVKFSSLDTTEGSTTYRTDTLIQSVSSNTKYGLNALFGTAGNAILGAGEGKDSLLSELAGVSSENAYIIADNNIYFHPNANSYNRKKTITLGTDGTLTGLAGVTATTFTGNLTGNVTGNCSGSSGSCTGNAATATKATSDANGREIATGYMWRGSYERIVGTSEEHKDLNTYQDAGFYNVKTALVDNCPSGIGVDAVLLVYPWDHGNYPTQEITEAAASSNARRWVRKCNNGTWSDWKRIAFTTDDISGTAAKATGNANGNEITDTVIKGLSISGKTITYTKIDGNTGTLTTQDTVYTHPTTSGNKHIPSGGSSGQFLGWDSDGTAKWVNNPNTNTDTLMTQNISTVNASYPILLCATANATADQGAKTGIFGPGVKVNPSTSTVTATTFSGALSGNASTATQFSAKKSVTLTGDVTGTASSKAGWSVATTLADSGVTAGTYGPSADVTGNNNATILVPEITVDAKGRVTSVTNRTYTSVNNTYNVYNKTLTIQKNGTNVATFTSNSNTDVTANIVVPTKTSDLTNDSNFVTTGDISSAINNVVIAEVNPGYFTVTQNRLDNAHATSAFAISPTLCLPSVSVSNAYDIDTTNWDVAGGDIHVVVQDANSKTVPGYVMIYLSKCAATDFVIIQLTSMARSAGIYAPTVKSGNNYYVKACFPTSGDFYVNIVKTAGTIGYAKLYPFLGNFGFVAPS